jgi:hypothetical protein
MISEIPGSRARALLIYPPVYDFALYDLFLKPYGLLRLGSMLEAGGWETRIINALDYSEPETMSRLGKVRRQPNGTGKIHRSPVELPEGLQGIKRRFARYGIIHEVFKALIRTQRPDTVFISSGMTYWYRGVVEAVDAVRGIWPDIPIVIGGVYASLMPDHCRSVCRPDFVAAGDVGVELDAWLRAKGLPGIGISAGSQPLDARCWTDAAVLRLNEGCPLNCDYCASKKINKRFRAGRSEDVFNWLVNINETRGTVNFAFYDDALLFKSEDVFKPFLEAVIDYEVTTGRSINFYTPNAMHIRYMDAETASLMKKAGFREVRLGFESESENFHLEHDNKYSAGSFFESIRMLTEAGFSRNEVIVYILAGLPGQRAAEVEDTIQFAAGAGLTLSVSEFSTVPGSRLWKKCVETCRFPIDEEPLYHNNSFFPMEWEHFTRDDMHRLKVLSKTAFTLSEQAACSDS